MIGRIYPKMVEVSLPSTVTITQGRGGIFQKTRLIVRKDYWNTCRQDKKEEDKGKKKTE